MKGNVPTDSRPPFVIRRVDDSLLQRRNFCGTIPYRPSVVSKDAGRGPDLVIHFGKDKGVCSSSSDDFLLESGKRGYRFRGDRSPTRSQPYTSRLDYTSSNLSLKSVLKSPNSQRRSPRTTPYPSHTSSIQYHTSSKDLLSKYLVTDSGNRRPWRCDVCQPCPRKRIEEKIERLKQECSECLVSYGSSGDDSDSSHYRLIRYQYHYSLIRYPTTGSLDISTTTGSLDISTTTGSLDICPTTGSLDICPTVPLQAH